jgi:hypothetical protein
VVEELKLITLRHQVVIKPASVSPAAKYHRPVIEAHGSTAVLQVTFDKC